MNDEKTFKQQLKLHRQKGVTPHERYLNQLCEKSFLTLWSHAGIYRDQKDKPDASIGKEVCDLLVVFGNNILIFSDKACAFPNTGSLELDWARWFKRAIIKSAEQIWGAERWIINNPDRLFLDSECKHPFPFELPDLSTAKFHRIVVAHECSSRCKQEYGGSGSLIIMPDIIGNMHYSTKDNSIFPYGVGQLDITKGYVHIFDDTSLEIVMNKLDTITDFVQYLTKKEKFITSGLLYTAAGEEELLAYYLKNINDQGEHDFLIPNGSDRIILEEGHWEEFDKSPQRQAQIIEDTISYLWDDLIETFNENVINGTIYHTTHPGFKNQEKALRYLAREPRTYRRALSKAILDLMKRTPSDGWSARLIWSYNISDTCFVFVLFPPREDKSYAEYRKVRQQLLADYCMVVKLVMPKAINIVGIATEPSYGRGRSEDLVYFDASTWTKEDEDEAKRIQSELGLFKNYRRYDYREDEYPDEEGSNFTGGDIKLGITKYPRNKPCPCGSGKKFKRCCGR